MNRNKFSFRSFFSLINQLHPQYIKFFVGILLGFISAGANLFVPQLAQKLINNFKSISPTLAILTVVIFIAGLITALCPVKYTDQIDKNFRRLDCGIVPRSSRFCLCKRVWY